MRNLVWLALLLPLTVQAGGDKETFAYCAENPTKNRCIHINEVNERLTALENQSGNASMRVVDADGIPVGDKVLGLGMRDSGSWDYSEELVATVLFNTTPNVILTVDRGAIRPGLRQVGAEFEISENRTLVYFADANCEGESTPFLSYSYENLLNTPEFVFYRWDPDSPDWSVRDEANNSNIWYIASGDELVVQSRLLLDRDGQILDECRSLSEPFPVRKIRVESVPNLDTEGFKSPFSVIAN